MHICTHIRSIGLRTYVQYFLFVQSYIHLHSVCLTHKVIAVQMVRLALQTATYVAMDQVVS